MCPYCGDDVAPGAKTCSRCGVSLEAGGEDDGLPILDVDGDDAPATTGGAAGATAAAAGRAKKTVDCPHCGEPNPAKAHRCRACARPIRELVTKEERAAEARFRRNVRLGVGGGVALLALVLLIPGLFFKTAPKNIEWSRITFAEVDRLFGSDSKMPDDKRKEVWNRSYARKWVRWEGRVTDVDSALFGTGALYLRHRPGPGEPDVRVEMPSGELEKSGVAEGATVSYAGRLASYGSLFELTDGQVFSAKR